MYCVWVSPSLNPPAALRLNGLLLYSSRKLFISRFELFYDAATEVKPPALLLMSLVLIFLLEDDLECGPGDLLMG